METELYKIQTNIKLDRSVLYWTYSCFSKHAPPETTESGFTIHNDTLVSFDSYFNSLYHNWWQSNTQVKDVKLALKTTGTGMLIIYNKTPDGDHYVIHRETIQENGEHTIEIAENPNSGRAGRVWFEIQTSKRETLTIQEASWRATNTQPEKVKLGLVFCTFNREKELAAILEELNNNPKNTKNVSKIFLINQGQKFKLSDLSTDLTKLFTDKITIIEQDNFGGCGGFTRGLLEIKNDENLTHFILLDDDIELPSSSIKRASAFFELGQKNKMLGGHMLDQNRPAFLYEAGAIVDPDEYFIHGQNHQVFVGDTNGLDQLLEEYGIDYNGWWFFGGNKKVLETQGLPRPCFIRGDDVEYGTRLKNSGIHTVPLPGVAVWHEPFYLKTSGWQQYFDVRNKLVMMSMENSGNWAKLKKSFIKEFGKYITLFQYHRAALLIQALEDYQKGKKECFETTDKALKQCGAIIKTYGPEKNEEPLAVPPLKHLNINPKLHKPYVGLQTLKNQITTPTKTGYFKETDATPERIQNLKDYYAKETYSNTVWHYKRNTKTEKNLTKRFLKTLKTLRYMPEYDTTRKPTENRFLEYWENVFKKT